MHDKWQRGSQGAATCTMRKQQQAVTVVDVVWYTVYGRKTSERGSPAVRCPAHGDVVMTVAVSRMAVMVAPATSCLATCPRAAASSAQGCRSRREAAQQYGVWVQHMGRVQHQLRVRPATVRTVRLVGRRKQMLLVAGVPPEYAAAAATSLNLWRLRRELCITSVGYISSSSSPTPYGWAEGRAGGWQPCRRRWPTVHATSTSGAASAHTFAVCTPATALRRQEQHVWHVRRDGAARAG